MDLVRQYANKFNRGEIDAATLARDDINKVNNSGALMTNFMPMRLGPMMYRPGTEYLGAVAGDTYMVPFIAATDDTAILEFSASLLRVWVSDALLTTTTRATTIANGAFTTNLTSWTDADESGGTSAFVTGGYCGLTGSGTASAIRWQTTTLWDTAAEHRLRIVVLDAPILLELGTGGAVHNKDYFSGILEPGTHSLVFTPSADVDITISNSSKMRALVDSIAFETTGTFTIPTAVGASSMPSIRYSQSADVLFATWDDGRQFKIERRGTKSWSVVDYLAYDGPFNTINTSDVTLTPGALSGGNQTLTASKGYFVSTDVDVIFKLISQGQEVTASLTAEDTGTNSVRVSGVAASRIFIITITGLTASGSTVTLQRSTDDASWTDVESYTTNQSKNFDDGFDNSILHYRLHIKTGDYGAGTQVCALEYEGGSIEGTCIVTSYTSATVVRVNIVTAFGRTDATRNWYRGSWSGGSSNHTFPSATSLYEGRLWMAGKNKAWGSVSDAFASFDIGIEGDSASIQKTIGFGPVDQVEWLLPLNRLIMGIASDELAIRSNSFGDTLTPSNTNIKRGSSQGAGGIDPLVINSRGYFVQRSLQKIYEIEYGFNQDIHEAQDLTVLNPSICSAGIKRIAFTMQPEIRIYVVLDDGTARVFLMDKTEDVMAWSRLETDGNFEDVCVLPSTGEDRVYFTINRTGGQYLEKLALFTEAIGGSTSKHHDSFVKYTSPGTTLTGLDHLDGKTVYIWADGEHRETALVASGSVTLSAASTSWTNVVAGLLHTADWTSSKLGKFAEYTMLMHDKRVVKTGYILKDYWPGALQVGPDSSSLSVFPLIEDGTTAPTTTQASYDQKQFPFDGTSETDPRIHLQAKYPVTIQAMAYSLEESVELDPPADRQLDNYAQANDNASEGQRPR